MSILGTNGTIASGQDLEALPWFGSSTYTYTEYGGRTISFAGGGYIGGSYNDYESTSQSYTLSDSTFNRAGCQRHDHVRHGRLLDHPGLYRQPVVQ